MIDPDQMRQVLLNIVNNAGDAMDGPGSITLSTGCTNGQVRLTITDTGRGMTPDVVEKIFDPFFTTKEVGRGTGLGLSISLNIIQSMGGRIDVQSVPGAGSSFNIMLPLKVSEENRDVQC
jgi:two-component system NtrC family sensor kinase